ncbi:unnamed protein product [Urochloa humidicola]
MASSDGVGGESSGSKRRERDGDYIEDDGEISCGKRSLLSSDDDDDDDDEYIYEYDDNSDGGDYNGHYDISDAEQDTNVDVPAGGAKNKPYETLTEDEIFQLQASDTASIAEVLSISPAFAAFLLRRYKWDLTNLQDDWFSDDRRVRAAAGLPSDGSSAAPIAMALSTSPLICAICFDEFPAGRTRSAACGAHFYCDGCWRGYIHAAVGDGLVCLSLRCPDPSCPAAVVADLIGAVAGAADTERYANFAFRSYVEESGGRIKWCPGRGCARAARFVGDAITYDDAATEVLCKCGNEFCWRCSEEPHRPVSCGTVRAWLAKNKSDSETANWVLANTKLCPKCHRAIEKNQGCNHMRCPDPCGHHFCWLCFKPAGTPNHYACDIYQPRTVASGRGNAVESKEEATARQARASLDRYLFHYERWAGNLRSLQKAKQDMEEMERSELEGMAAVVGRPATELEFMTEAYEQVIYGRRVLRWAHAYGYYLDPETDGTKRQLFDYLQSDANNALERLHKCVELERKDVFRSEGEAVDVARRFKEYKQKMLP